MRIRKQVRARAALLGLAACLALAAAAQSPASSAQRRAPAVAQTNAAGVYSVRAFGARGDGRALDSGAVNRAIEAASAVGGGTVHFPAGTYLCFSIRLKSNIALRLDHGATILAADPAQDKGSYDLPEPNPWDMYQDFGHSHWQNSLIWGIGVENVSIEGPGKIDGKGLTKRSPGPRRPSKPGDTPVSMGGANAAGAKPLAPLGEDADVKTMEGLGNKAISLKLCRNVTLRDFTILRGGHFALLATGVDNLTDRQPARRHQPRRLRHRLLPQRPRLQLHRQLAERRRHRPQKLLRARLRARHRKHDHHQLPGLRLRRGDASRRHFQARRRNSRPTATATAASSSARSPTAASRTSPSPTASSTAAAASR